MIHRCQQEFTPYPPPFLILHQVQEVLFLKMRA
jgi:hypothetical protein